jgi:Spy/CpxP family protein refolding chaperone
MLRRARATPLLSAKAGIDEDPQLVEANRRFDALTHALLSGEPYDRDRLKAVMQQRAELLAAPRASRRKARISLWKVATPARAGRFGRERPRQARFPGKGGFKGSIWTK